jgi:putative ABC transport system permease protein
MKTQRTRTFITLFIIATGILALVGTLTVVNALNNTFTGNLKTIGANSFFIRPYANSLLQGRRRHGRFTTRKANPPITWSEAKRFKEKYKFPGTIVSTGLNISGQAQLSRGSKKTSKQVVITGIDENYLQAYGFRTGSGRNFTGEEILSGTPVAIAGPQVIKALFDKENPLGKYVYYRGHKWKIIGVTVPKGTSFGQSEDNFVFIPITLARKITAGNTNAPYEIRVSVLNPENYEKAKEKAIQQMRSIRHLRPGQENNFGITGSKEALNELKKINTVLQTAAFIIGLITILASAIALMNIMLVSVTEKLNEIGIRKAVGASNRHILQQFLTETWVIALSGSLLGIITGILAGWGIASLLKIDFSMPWNAVFWAIFITFITALLSGLYPAFKASKANPIEVLRYE